MTNTLLESPERIQCPEAYETCPGIMVFRSIRKYICVLKVSNFKVFCCKIYRKLTQWPHCSCKCIVLDHVCLLSSPHKAPWPKTMLPFQVRFSSSTVTVLVISPEVKCVRGLCATYIAKGKEWNKKQIPRGLFIQGVTPVLASVRELLTFCNEESKH